MPKRRKLEKYMIFWKSWKRWSVSCYTDQLLAKQIAGKPVRISCHMITIIIIIIIIIIIVKPFRLTYMASSFKLNYCLSNLLLSVDQQTYPNFSRIQFESCQYLWNASDRGFWSCGVIGFLTNNFSNMWSLLAKVLWKSPLTLLLGNPMI